MIDTTHARVELVFECPFCKAKAAVLKKPIGLMHDYPACWSFVNLEPDEYLHAVNESKRSLN